MGTLDQTKFYHWLKQQAAQPSGIFGKILTGLWPRYFKKQSSWLLSQVDIEAVKCVLDVGFGGGINIKHLLESNPTAMLYGIDISEESLKTAEHLIGNNSRVFLSQENVENLPFSNNFFDLILATQTHIFWENLNQGLGECYRVLRNGGCLLISTEKEKLKIHLPEYLDSQTFVRLLNQTGFKQVKTCYQGKFVAFICKKRETERLREYYQIVRGK